jgi:nicotinate-nucleotide adenylyltransferase
MKIGLYFGSFNPIHIGHLIIASYMFDAAKLKKVWFVVSPQNPLKPSNTLLNEYHRLHLVNLAIENDNRFNAINIEFSLPKPSYTINTLTYLKEKYPQHQFSIIMGGDSLQNLPNWKNYESIINNFEILVYNRNITNNNTSQHLNLKQFDAPLLDISATQIRQNIKQGNSNKYLLSKEVLDEIELNNYYK